MCKCMITDTYMIMYINIQYIHTYIYTNIYI